MQEFQFAALEADAEKPDEEIEIPFPDRTLIAKRPTPGAVSAFHLRASGLSTDDDPHNGFTFAMWHFLSAHLSEDDVDYLKHKMLEGRITTGTLFGGDGQNSQGLINVLIAQASGRPTEPSNDSSESPKPTGRRSTGRAAGKGSTSSSSASTGS